MTKSANPIAQLMQQAQQHETKGQVQPAENCYKKILQQQANYHPAWHAWGLLAYRAGNLDFAVALIDKAVKFQPLASLYQRNLGELQRRLGKLDDAMKYGMEACRLAPDDIDAHYNLGLACTDKKDYSNAISAYKRALELDPNHGLSWNNLGSALEQQGDKVAAQEAYAKAVALNARHTEAQNNLGALYCEQGKLDDARTCFAAAIAARPDFVEAHHNLSSLKTYRKDDPHLAQLEAIYSNRTGLSDHARIRYSFALGKALDDTGDYERAFNAYQEGNQLQHKRLPMNEQHADTLLTRITELFNADFFKKRSRWKGNQDNNRTPIFIVGMPRSGTTLLEQILCSHPSVYGAGELGDLNQVISKCTQTGKDRSFIDGVTTLTAAEMRQLGKDYIKRVWGLSPESAYITDKMPANFFYLGLIHLALPNAKIIHAMRDPMDSCFSCYSRLFNDSMEFAYDQGTLGRYYVRYMKLMQHWHAVLPKHTVLDLRYEDMVKDTETQARRILDFVGLPWNENCLQFHKNDRLVKTASVAQVRKPIYTTSLARWKHFERQLQPLLHIVQEYTPNKPLFAPPERLELEQARTVTGEHQ